MNNRMYYYDNVIVTHEMFEMLYEEFIDHAEILFQVIDVTHVKFAYGLNTEEKAFYFMVYDSRLYYDYVRNEYRCDSANRYTWVPLSEIIPLIKRVNYYDINSEDFDYYTINLNGGLTRRFHLVKRLKTDVRLIKIRVEDINAVLAYIRKDKGMKKWQDRGRFSVLNEFV